MIVKMITYDLPEGHDDTELVRCLEQYHDRLRLVHGTWLIRTDDDAAKVRDRLMPFLNDGDKLFVSELWGSWAGSYNLGEEALTWLTHLEGIEQESLSNDLT